ncbi:GntR family transcriptional regulator [Kineococcus sp. SYSU DK002]|uniref:GntR family transcriptional regulator n=1 Tax=Kineococcus sp. SYSU DK002 TaxID=3383123 RepID=UPI003D7CDCB4
MVSRAGRAAEEVRRGVLDGTYRVGSRLSEPDLCARLDVSRNTLREAFRMLADERLVVHELNRGVFVRVPDEQDVRELFEARRLVECAAVHGWTPGRAGLDAAHRAVERGGERAAAGDWAGVAEADVEFHRALTALGSARVDDLMQGVWHEVRLALHVVAAPARFHGAHLPRNRSVLTTLAERGGPAAARELRTHLDEAEREVLSAYPRRA